MPVGKKEPQEMKGWMALIIVGLIVGAFAYLMAKNGDRRLRTRTTKPQYQADMPSVSYPAPVDPAAEAIALIVEGTGHLEHAGKQIEAEAAFTKAAIRNPGNAKAWLALGWARFNNGRRFCDAGFTKLRFELAKEAFENCLRIEPRNQSALNGLGQLAMIHRRFDDAECHFIEANGDPAAWAGLLRLYLLREKFSEAEKWGAMVVESNPNDHYARMMLRAAREQTIDAPLMKYLETDLLAPTMARGGAVSVPAKLLEYLEMGRSWLEDRWNDLTLVGD